MSIDTLPPPAVLSIFDNDEVRAPKNGTPAEHAAADRSAATREIVNGRVLHILSYQRRSMTGEALNREYARRWPDTAQYESPRKRAGEMSRRAVPLVNAVNRTDGKDHPYIYSITDAGVTELGKRVDL